MDNKHIETIAEGTGSELLSEIREEVNSILHFLEQVSIQPTSLRPESQFALKRIRSFVQESENISSLLSTYHKRVKDIEFNQKIQQVLALEEKLKNCTSSRESSRIIRELRYLKSIHSRKLSDLVSNKQKVLHERLRLLYIWKSILNYEIHILDNAKTLVVSTIVQMANSSGEEETLEMVRTRLRNLPVHDSIINELKIDLDAIKIANIHVLQQELLIHLDDAEKIEQVVNNKKEIVQVLSSIIQDVQKELPSPPPEPTMTVPSQLETESPASPAKTETKDEQAPASNKSRMAFTSKDKN